MKKNEQKRADGRGRSEGSRRNQFKPGNQAARNRSKPRQKRVPDNAIEQFREAIFQEVMSTKGGKRRKIPYIDALIQKTLADALNAPIADRLKLLREIEALGIFDAQTFKERMERTYKDYCDNAFHKNKQMQGLLDDFEEKLLPIGIERSMYKLAFDICCQKCTCGVAGPAFTQASEFTLETFAEELKKESRAQGLYDDECEDDEPPT